MKFQVLSLDALHIISSVDHYETASAAREALLTLQMAIPTAKLRLRAADWRKRAAIIKEDPESMLLNLLANELTSLCDEQERL